MNMNIKCKALFCRQYGFFLFYVSADFVFPGTEVIILHLRLLKIFLLKI